MIKIKLHVHLSNSMWKLKNKYMFDVIMLLFIFYEIIVLI
jgi:hypothetical protein